MLHSITGRRLGPFHRECGQLNDALIHPHGAAAQLKGSSKTATSSLDLGLAEGALSGRGWAFVPVKAWSVVANAQSQMASVARTRQAEHASWKTTSRRGSNARGRG